MCRSPQFCHRSFQVLKNHTRKKEIFSVILTFCILLDLTDISGPKRQDVVEECSGVLNCVLDPAKIL